jgi:WD40 repeat protein
MYDFAVEEDFRLESTRSTISVREDHKIVFSIVQSVLRMSTKLFMIRRYKTVKMVVPFLFLSLLYACGSARFQRNLDLQQESTPRPTRTTMPTVQNTPSPVVEVDPTQESTPSPIRIETISSGNLSQLESKYILQGHTDDVTDVAFSPDGSLLASSSMDGDIRLWRTVDGGLERVLRGHRDHVLSLDFSPDGNMLLSGSDDRTARIWTIADGAQLKSIGNDLLGRVLEVAYSPEGTLIALAGHNCIVELRSATTGILRRTLAQPRCVSRQGGSVSNWGMIFSPAGDRIVTGDGRPCCGGSIHSWQIEGFASPELIRGYNLVIRDMASNYDGSTWVVAFVGSSNIWLLRPDAPFQPRLLEGHLYRVNSVDFSPNGELFASGSRDATIRLWKMESGLALRTLEGHSDGVNIVAFSPQGHLIASGSEDDTVILWALQEP